MAIGPRLRAILGLDRSQFSRGLKGAEGEVEGFGRKIKGIGGAMSAALGVGIPAVTVASTVTFLRQTVRGIAAVGDEARRSGLGLRAFQEWKFVAEQNRIGVDALVDGFKELSLRADEFVVTGGGSAAEAFGRLGLSAQDLERKLKDPSALMLEIIGRLQRFDSAARIRITDEIFGGAGGEQLLQILGKSEGELRAMIRRGHELGAVMEDQMVAKADALDRKFAEVETRIGTLVKQTVVGGFMVAEAYAKMREENGDLFGMVEVLLPQARILGEVLGGVMGSTADAASEATQQIAAVEAEVQSAGRSLAQDLHLVAAQLLQLGEVAPYGILDALASEAVALTNQLDLGRISADEFQAAMADLNRRAAAAVLEVSKIDGISLDGVIGRIGAMSKAIQAAVTLAQSLRAALPSAGGAGGPAGAEPEWQPVVVYGRGARPAPKAPSELGVPEITGRTGGGGGRAGGARGDDFARELAQTRDQIATLEAEALVLTQVAAGNRQLGDAMEFARKKAELLLAAKKAGKAITPELTAEIEREAMAYMTAGLNAAAAADHLERIRENALRGGDAMTDLFAGILQGSDAAKQAVAGLLLEIARVQLRKGVFSLGGGSGFFGWVGGLLGSNARGTNNWQGGWSRVNELGGEIMNLPSGTQVIPHDISKRMADASGRGGGLARLSVEAVPNAYFDTRVAQISQVGDAAAARAQARALPGQITTITARRD